jgi:glucose/arabinose dehydrogenase/cytochrome c2
VRAAAPATIFNQVRYISRDTRLTCEDSMNGRRIEVYVTLGVLASALCGVPKVAAAALFQQQCTVCHTAEANDQGGAQGPSLAGVFNRHAAGDPTFSYTAALRDSKVIWNATTLNRFLTAPARMIPGTAMAVAITDPAQRADVVAYLEVTKAPAVAGSATPAAAAAPATDADWKKDAPGRAHRVDLAALPAPFATPSARNLPKLVPRPAYAQLLVPKGFKVGMFAKDLDGPRKILVTPGGDVFVTETRGGRVSVLHPAADGRSSATTQVFAQGLDKPFGIAFYPNADTPKWLYVAETNRVIRFAFAPGDVKARGAPEVVIPELASTGGHSTRDIVFSPDGRRMYISVGSQSNVAESMSKKTPAQVQEWEAAHGLGAAWDLEENRADVLVFDVDAKRPGKVFASGIRNCVSLTLQPGTNSLWCTTNERDLLGDDLVPDYSTRVSEGSFFGWPWYYMGSHEDPRLQGDRPDLAAKVSVPDVPYQAHSAALGLIFYTSTSGKAAFPAQYVGDGFAMLHGSWNRGFRTGHKVVRVRMKNGVPTGEYDDFLTGFIVDDGDAWGRPVSGAVLSDGSLLVSDDGANVIYRITYEP